MELKDYLAIFRKRILVIIGVTVVVFASTLGFSYMQKPVYKASTTLMVSASMKGFEEFSAIQIIEKLLLTINKLSTSRPVLEKASETVNHKKNVRQFQDAVSSQVLTNTQLIQISASAGNPQAAMAMANAAADSLVAFVREKEGASSSYKIEQVEPALKPTSPVSPKPLRNGMMGVFLGLILGFGVASLLEYLDVSVKSKDELSVLLEKPVLGEIPLVTYGKLENGKQESSETGEILEQTRTLRTNIQYLDLENNLKTILLTSPQLKEGKTFLSLQLARAYTAAGKKVVLVDADLRKELHHFEKTPSEKGITNVIVGSLELADAFVDTDMELLKYLPSGPLPPNPSEMLDSSGMRRLLADLGKDFDIIIMDTSPIGMFSDPLVLASKVDGVILIAAARSTSNASLKAASELLMGPNINLLGIVLNRVKVSRQHYYDYYRRDKKKRSGKGRG